MFQSPQKPETSQAGLGTKQGLRATMFHTSSSSSSDEESPFSAIKAAADAKRRITPANPDDPLYKAITASLNNPRERVDPPLKRESRYIGKLVEKAELRKEESARIGERRLVARQREEDALYGGKERFVTNAYKRKLKEEEGREIRERIEDREAEREKGNAATFYAGLFKGVNRAMGGHENHVTKVEHNRNADETPVTESQPQSAPNAQEVSNESSKTPRKRRRSRFADMQPVTVDERPPQPGVADDADGTGLTKVVKKRGERRNDAGSIEQYRRRYFARRAARLAKAAG